MMVRAGATGLSVTVTLVGGELRPVKRWQRRPSAGVGHPGHRSHCAVDASDTMQILLRRSRSGGALHETCGGDQ